MSSQTSPPELQTLRIEIGEGGVGTMTLNRPDSFNAMSPEMIGELTTAFSWLADLAPLRALVLTGAGKAFSAGGDVNWFSKGVESEEIDLPSSVRRGADVLHQAIIDLRRIPYPVIAAVNGPAAGAGFSLALACDFRVAADSAFFAPAYGRIGASPDGGMTYFLPRVVGPSRALEILLDDPNMSAEDALAEGLVSEVVAADELPEAARAKAAKLAAMAPHYVRMAKYLCGVSLENGIAEHLQLERHGIADSMATEDLRNGVKAFFAGEKPEFHGN
ncbi:MAG: 2-(1,2-epoxy,2-dihydrophenyl)acetyl-CoA isomerase [Solirubrobacterales bacterium]|jgi:enoyl-CoA hydratase/carnithine racemase|nr:2-(1,2-epoxy,2-dihydrophenyl)acetyl-CoA isomerase [Solirubrobacterales bacterium]